MDVVFFLQKILIYLGLGFGSIGYFVMLYWAYTGKIEVEGEPFESETAQRSFLYIAIFLIVASVHKVHSEVPQVHEKIVWP